MEKREFSLANRTDLTLRVLDGVLKAGLASCSIYLCRHDLGLSCMWWVMLLVTIPTTLWSFQAERTRRLVISDDAVTETKWPKSRLRFTWDAVARVEV